MDLGPRKQIWEALVPHCVEIHGLNRITFGEIVGENNVTPLGGSRRGKEAARQAGDPGEPGGVVSGGREGRVLPKKAVRC